MAPAEIIGRDEELARVREFVSSLAAGPGALVIRGEAGIGKTTLWRAGIEKAREQSLRVLVTSPVEAEAQLSFAGLGDLLRDATDEVLPRLPPPQRRALEVALLLAEDEQAPPDRRAVAAALAAALRALAESVPVLVAVDDVQWLDPASAGALAFAVRRLGDDRIGLLLSQRETVSRPLPLGLERALRDDRLRALDLSPLTLGALHRLLQERIGATFPRPTLLRINEGSGGNPLFALELARALVRDGVRLKPGEPFPVPATLAQLVSSRIAALPPATRPVLAAAAALSEARVSVLEAALGAGVRAALDPALESDVVAVDGDRLRFAHPLLASAAYAAGGRLRRRDLHRALAAAVEDVEERARHLALAADRPDPATAAALDEAARQAHARGAPAVAAQLAEEAYALSPPEDGGRDRRVLEAALFHFESGNSRRARTLLEDLVARLPAGPARALALTRLARVRSYSDDLRRAASLHLQALEEAGDDDAVRGEAHEGFAACSFRLREGLGEAIAHARAAEEIAQERGDTALVMEALGVRLLLEAMLAREDAPRTLAELLARSGEVGHERILRLPELHAAVAWMWWDDLERAREAYESLAARAREIGDESSLPYVLFLLAQTLCRLGAFEAAGRAVDEAHELTVQAGQAWMEAQALALRALTDAYSGRADAARDLGERALVLAERTGAGPARQYAAAALGHVALVSGEPAEADRRLAPLVTWARREGVDEPGVTAFTPDAVEAVLDLGRLDEGKETLAWYEANAARLGRASGLAAAARLRALLAAAGGNTGEAVAGLEAALAEASWPLPLERGRALLALGVIRRRSKQKRAARDALHEARALFEVLGAAGWAERTRLELARIGGRAPAGGGLTPTERRVAALVAEGLSSKQVAAEVFVSVKTVEGHLSRIYRKLGIHSRAALAAKLAEERLAGTRR